MRWMTAIACQAAPEPPHHSRSHACLRVLMGLTRKASMPGRATMPGAVVGVADIILGETLTHLPPAPLHREALGWTSCVGRDARRGWGGAEQRLGAPLAGSSWAGAKAGRNR